jgi:hypothetical protein
MAVIVTPATDYELPAYVLADLEVITGAILFTACA